MRSQNPLDDRLGGDAEMPVEVNPLMPTNIVFQPITIGCQPGIYITAIVLRKAHPNVVEPGSGSGPSSAGQSVSFFLAALRAKQIEKKVQPPSAQLTAPAEARLPAFEPNGAPGNVAGQLDDTPESWRRSD
jgi:hypothetical protein